MTAVTPLRAPSLAAWGGTAQEFLLEGVTGFLSAPGDVASAVAQAKVLWEQADECERMGALGGAEINAAKIRLANEVTTLCHGAEAAAAAEATARAVFEEGGVGDDLPTLTLTPAEVPADGIPVVQLLVRAGLAGSGKDARRLIAEGGARLDDAPLTDAGLHLDAGALAATRKLSAGRKRHALVRLAD